MTLLTRYFLRQLLAPTTLALVAFAGAVWVSQALRFVDLIVNKGLSVGRFLYLTSLLVPSLVLVVLPFAAFVGALAGYHKLRAESEISVCRAAGLSDWQLGRAAVWLGVVFAALSYLTSLYVMPTAYRHFRGLQHEITRDFSALAFQAGVFTSVTPGLTVYVGERLPSGDLGRLVVHDTRRGDQAVTLVADSGDLVRGADGPILALKDGNYQERAADGSLSVVYFDETVVELGSTSSPDGDRVAKTREMYVGELLQGGAAAAGLDDAQLRQRRLMVVEAHERLSWPLLSLALPLIAATCILRFRWAREQGWPVSVAASGLAMAVVVFALMASSAAKANLAMLPLLYAAALVPTMACLVLLVSGRRLPSPLPA